MLVNENNIIPNDAIPFWGEEIKKQENAASGTECLRSLIKLMVQEYYKNLTQQKLELDDEKCD